MSKTKKILSVILCLIMVLSTVIVGFVTNATVVDGVKDYEDLTDEYEEFVYIATTFTNSKGEVISKDSANVSEGETITCNVYLKSDQTIWQNSIINLVFDKKFFKEAVTNGVQRPSYDAGASKPVKATVANNTVEAIADDIFPDGEVAEYLSEVVTAEELENNWSFAEITLKGTSAAHDGYARYQVPADLTSDDEPIFSFNLQVNANLNGYVNGYVKVVPELYSINENATGDELYSIYWNSRSNADPIENFIVEDADWTFTASDDKEVTFVDTDGTVISKVMVPKNGTVAVKDIPTDAQYDIYMWADARGTALTPEQIAEIAVARNVTYTVIKASTPITFTDGGDEIATITGKKGKKLAAADIPNADTYDVYKWIDTATGKEYTPAELAELTITGPMTFDINKASVALTFMNGEEVYAGVTGKKGQKVQAPDASGIENFYKWKDAEGKLYTADDLAKVTVTGEATYVAVTSDGEVAVTIDLDGAVLENVPEGVTVDEETGLVTFTAPITGFDISAFVPVKEDAGEFSGWKDENGNTYTGNTITFTSDIAEITLKPVFGVQVAIMVLPLDYETETVTVKNADGKETEVEQAVWQQVGTYAYTGESGDLVNAADLIDIQKYINTLYDDIEATVVTESYRDENGEPTVVFGLYDSSKGTLSDSLSTDAANYGNYYVNNDATQIGGKNVAVGNEIYSFGEAEGKTQLKAIYLKTAVKYDVEAYVPTMDSNGDPVEDENGKFGLTWGEPKYKTNVIFSSIETVDGSNRPYYNSVINSTIETEYFGYVDKANASIELDETKYKPLYLNGNGEKMRNNEIRVLFRASDVTEGKLGTIQIYFTIEDRVYHVGYSVGQEVYAAKQTYKFGDEISLDDIKEVYLAKYVVGNQYDAAPLIKTTSLYESGEPVNMKGYELINVYYNNADGEQVNVNDGGNAVIDLDFINNYKKTPNAEDSEDLYLCFNTDWSGIDYTFDIYYQNAKEEWVLLTSKVYSGDESVTYNSAIGAGSKLDKKVQADHPSFLAPMVGLTLEKGGTTATLKAYDAANETNTLAVYVEYANVQRYAFIDYNNAYDQEGNLNVDKVGEGVRYTRLNCMYADLLFDPAYDKATAEEGATEPKFYQTMNGGFTVPTIPDETQKKDAEGNKMYEAEQVQAVDEDGKPVYNTDGTPKMVDKVDEEGNVVYDKSKPIMVDLKGNTATRPYRNCEFIGFKVYYVDGVYSSFEDLPDQAEWKEGYNDRNEKGAQHLYTTTILQVQWIADSSFRYRVYDDGNELSFAKGKNGKKYYWDMNGAPCAKGENVLVRPKGDGTVDKFLIFFKIVKEDGNGLHFKAVSLSKDFLNITTTSGYIPLILNLVKGLLK